MQQYLMEFLVLCFIFNFFQYVIKKHRYSLLTKVCYPFFSLKASSSVGSSGSKLIDHFVGMGFPEKMVAEAIQENGKDPFLC